MSRGDTRTVLYLRKCAAELRFEHAHDADPGMGEDILTEAMAQALEIAATAIENGEHNQ